MFKENPDFYPTPKSLISKMLSKVKYHSTRYKNILEPSAGSGHIVDYIKDLSSTRYYRGPEIFTIEKDPNLQNILIGKKYNLIDSDFLTYNGGQHFDLIIANFPFSEGDKHLMKALDIMFNGHIVCLVNAETIKNPCTNLRKELVKKLKELNADIEYLEESFSQAERKTLVEVALIHIHVERSVEDDLYQGMSVENEEEFAELEGEKSLATKDDVFNLVKRYEMDRTNTVEQIVKFYENYSKVNKYISLNVHGDDEASGESTLTEIMQGKINRVIKYIKRDYWHQTMKLSEVRRRLTSKKKQEIKEFIENYEQMEFSVKNIEIFITNLIAKFPKMIEESIEFIFDELTRYGLQDSRWGNEFKTNIHYFSGWKTNNSYKVNKKVILPRICEVGYRGDLSMVYRSESILDDLELVARYFSLMKHGDELAYDICKTSVDGGKTTKIDTGMFLITLYKKGTAHIEWKDEDALRWFNIEACKIKKFLPMDYAEKDMKDMSDSEKNLSKSFEGKGKYKKVSKLGVLGTTKGLLAITA